MPATAAAAAAPSLSLSPLSQQVAEKLRVSLEQIRQMEEGVAKVGRCCRGWSEADLGRAQQRGLAQPVASACCQPASHLRGAAYVPLHSVPPQPVQIQADYEEMKQRHTELQRGITALQSIQGWRDEVAELEKVRRRGARR